MSFSNFRQAPVMPISDDSSVVTLGWEPIRPKILSHNDGIIAIEVYSCVLIEELLEQFSNLPKVRVIYTETLMKSSEEIAQMIFPDVTDDPVFGFRTRLKIKDYFPQDVNNRLLDLQQTINLTGERLVLIGPGALELIPQAETRVYADMPRWEGQLRQRNQVVDGLGTKNRHKGGKYLYKQAYFVDWRVLDRHKKLVFNTCHFYLETVNPRRPALLPMNSLLEAFQELVARPFELMPFFDPGVWGGHWMSDKLGIQGSAPNYAWCFNCVPEENSILLGFGPISVEIPSINLVFFQTQQLLGAPVYSRFGDEFPIRFDFLDTLGGQNLSFQVHPRTEYIQEHFGMHYTQDESYYILDALPGAQVYLGLQEGVSPSELEKALRLAGEGSHSFEAERFVQTWPAKKHDHFLIPAGTVHCSGADTMVLEVSATPYIFTFKLWDWGRVDFDGKPRPINVDRGIKNIDFCRTTPWVKNQLINRIELIAEGEGWREEKTGLHENEFIETRRHWFSVPVQLDTGGVDHGSVHVLNLIEGEEMLVESPNHSFDPFPVHYAETFVVPARVGEYTLRPYGVSEGKTIAVLRAYVRLGGSNV